MRSATSQLEGATKLTAIGSGSLPGTSTLDFLGHAACTLPSACGSMSLLRVARRVGKVFPETSFGVGGVDPKVSLGTEKSSQSLSTPRSSRKKYSALVEELLVRTERAASRNISSARSASACRLPVSLSRSLRCVWRSSPLVARSRIESAAMLERRSASCVDATRSLASAASLAPLSLLRDACANSKSRRACISRASPTVCVAAFLCEP